MMSTSGQVDATSNQPVVHEIRVELNRVSRAALSVLTADGASITDAVRRALVDAAERAPEPSDASAPAFGGNLAALITTHVDSAPPLSPYQRYVLHTVFVEHRQVWLPEAEWEAQQQASASRAGGEGPAT